MALSDTDVFMVEDSSGKLHQVSLGALKTAVAGTRTGFFEGVEIPEDTTADFSSNN